MKNVGLDACIPCPNFAVHQANLPNWIESRSVLESSISDQSSFGFVSIDLHRQLDQVNRIIAQLESGADGPAT